MTTTSLQTLTLSFAMTMTKAFIFLISKLNMLSYETVLRVTDYVQKASTASRL